MACLRPTNLIVVGTKRTIQIAMSRFAAIAVICLISGCWRPEEQPEAPLPDAMTVKAVHVTWAAGAAKHYADITWDVGEHCAEIVDALKPNRREPHPARWVVAGALKITTKDGGQQLIWVFRPQDESIAFKIDETYYRGEGSLAELEKAIQAASHGAAH
jgi:hypothetical protein